MSAGMMTADAGTVNVSRLVDDGRVSAVQVAAMVMCGLVAFLDGLDSQSIAVGVSLIVTDLGLAKTAIGPILSSSLLGAMVGAMTFGPLGDRFGRKRGLVAAACVFGVFTVATAYVTSLPALLGVRFLAGLGLGGATPCFLALASEYAPKRRRATVASLIWAAFPLGAAATSVIGFCTGSVAAVSAIEAVAGFFVGMGASGSIALAALVYPTALRSSGIGWAMGMGRGGQVCATLLTGVLVGAGWGSTAVFLLLALASAAGAVGALLVHMQRRVAPVRAMA